jgi:RNA polymerase sigma-70 factor (ECF subfamily)
MEELHEHRFVELYHKYFHPLKHFVSVWVSDKDFAEDVVQETFTWLWEHRNQLDHVTNLNPFLYSIAKHKVYNYLRHKRIQRNYSENLIRLANTFYSDQSFEFNDTMTIALRQFTQKERLVFSLSRIQGLDNE